MHPYTHNSVKLTFWCWQWSEPMMRRETARLHWLRIHTYTFSKTHLLMLAMKWADDGERNKLLWSMTCIHTQFSETHHHLMLTMKWADAMRRETARLLWSCTCIYEFIQNSVKLTSWCWQWSKQMYEDRNSWSSNHAYIQNSVKLIFRCWQWSKQMNEKRNRLLWSSNHAYIHTEFRKTHLLMLACNEDSEQTRRKTN